ncbi:transferrin-binding protein-like solute binding protein [Neisseria sp.]|uniref:transferrin-binding protein-like solute binding protein n=1 Tax=Neisseria sp. TaxID=192066 RepID=UPI0026DB1DD5|nr:transferrin-binding protein-like solute binding protein [Neisseria sp.]MDO4906171.1 transferrin-binding protein-like solute binding protein [Neisseria sp.]
MSKKTTVKHIALTIACAAVLAACGGGGGGSTSADLVDNAVAARNVMNMIEALDEAAEITLEDKASVEAAAQSYNRLSDSQKSLIGKDLKDKLQEALDALAAASAAGTSTDGTVSTVDTSEISDNDSLASLNLPTPLHTSFISSSAAQQNNPHMQLRTVDGEPALRSDQAGLIRTLASNQNSAVVIDAVTLNNTTTVDNATEVSFTTPSSAISKAFSGGTSNEDISAQTGDDPNTVFSNVKTSFDARIVENYQKLEAAKKTLETAEKNYEIALANAEKSYDSAVAEADRVLNEVKEKGNQVEIQEAQAIRDIAVAEAEKQKEVVLEEPKKTKEEAIIEKEKIEAAYNNDRKLRKELSDKTTDAVSALAYFKKDKNGLVFDKKFDGVYMIQFADGTRITLHDPAAAGWTYQTFAHYVDPKNGITHGYQSIGDETAVSAMPTSGTATYTGITTAYLVETGKADRQLTADVKAVADFAKKGLRFETSNAQFHALNNGVRVSEAAEGYNMKGSASWSANSNSFTGTAATADNRMTGQLLGKFYGAQAAEIGGTYGLQNAGNTQQLIGGYGAKRP